MITDHAAGSRLERDRGVHQGRLVARRQDAPVLRAPRELHLPAASRQRALHAGCAAVALAALFKGRNDGGDTAHGHGFNGWLTTSAADPRSLFTDKALLRLLTDSLKVALGAGLGDPALTVFTQLDPNDLRNAIDSSEGLAITPLAVANGKRNGPREFLLRTKKEFQSQLTIKMHALAARILFDGKQAIGVEYYEGPHQYEADPAVRKPGRSRKQRQRAAAPGVRGAGSHPVRRRLQQPATAQALGHRPARRARAVRHPRRAGPAGRRREPAGSLRGRRRSPNSTSRSRCSSAAASRRRRPASRIRSGTCGCRARGCTRRTAPSSAS